LEVSTKPAVLMPEDRDWRAPVVVVPPAMGAYAVKEVSPVPPLATGSAVPERVTANVPDVVIGEPEMLKKLGTVIATEVTVPDVAPGGAAQVPSALRKFVVPPPDEGANPLRDDVNAGRIALTCATVKSKGLAVPPVLLPLIVNVGICARNLFLI